MFLSYQWGHWIFCLGGGGVIFCSDTLFLCFGFVVLVLVVYSIVSFFRILVVFYFSIAYSCRWCLGLA